MRLHVRMGAVAARTNSGITVSDDLDYDQIMLRWEYHMGSGVCGDPLATRALYCAARVVLQQNGAA